jgi:hypothetical protein
MSVAQSIGKLAGRMAAGGEFTGWADMPPARGATGTAWEKALIELVESGDSRFFGKLRAHLQSGAIRSERARAAIEAADGNAAA